MTGVQTCALPILDISVKLREGLLSATIRCPSGVNAGRCQKNDCVVSFCAAAPPSARTRYTAPPSAVVNVVNEGSSIAQYTGAQKPQVGDAVKTPPKQ